MNMKINLSELMIMIYTLLPHCWVHLAKASELQSNSPVINLKEQKTDHRTQRRKIHRARHVTEEDEEAAATSI